MGIQLKSNPWTRTVVAGLLAFAVWGCSQHADAQVTESGTNQAINDVNQAVKDIDQAQKDAQDNAPPAPLKQSEDKLDDKARTNEDAPPPKTDADKDAKNQKQKDENDARTDADNARQDATGADAEKASKYRDALARRRAARKKLKAAFAVLQEAQRGYNANSIHGDAKFSAAYRAAAKALTSSAKTIAMGDGNSQYRAGAPEGSMPALATLPASQYQPASKSPGLQTETPAVTTFKEPAATAAAMPAVVVGMPVAMPPTTSGTMLRSPKAEPGKTAPTPSAPVVAQASCGCKPACTCKPKCVCKARQEIQRR